MPFGFNKKAGVIGLGIIGSRAAANLRKQGYKTFVWSRSPHREPNFLASAAEVADAAHNIQLFVSDETAVRECIKSMVPKLGKKHIVANHATISPGFAKEMSALVESTGASYLDAPFTGSRAAAEKGELVYYIGGDEKILDTMRSQLEASSKAILHLGGVGDAAVVKLATNMISAVTIQTLVESLGFATSAGIAPEKFAEAIQLHGCNSPLIDMKLGSILEGDFTANFSLKHMLKDMRFALEFASGKNLELPATSVVTATLIASANKGHEELDFSAIAMHYGFEAKQESPGEVEMPEPSSTPSESDHLK